MATPTTPTWTRNSEDDAARRDLPEDLIQEIIARLPIKSILRFKSTCKTWFSLIRSPSFIQFHRLLHEQNGDDHRDDLFFSSSDLDEPYIISSSSLTPSDDFKEPTPLFDLSSLRKALFASSTAAAALHVVGPLDNGICCVIANNNEPDGYCNLALCNLATREFKVVDPFTRKNSFLLSQHHFGFGHVGVGGAMDYKIVVIQQKSCAGRARDIRSRASVYSVRRRKWKNLLDDDEDCAEITQGLYGYPEQALLNGCCHWMARDREFENRVVRFNVADEVFLSVIPGPPKAHYRNKYSNFVAKTGVCVVDNRLAAVILVKHHPPQREPYMKDIDVWLMMGDGCWTKIFTCWLSLAAEITRFLGMSFAKAEYVDVDGHNGGGDGSSRVIDRIVFEHSQGLLMSCQSYGVATHIRFKHSLACWKPLGLSSYVETLQPPPQFD